LLAPSPKRLWRVGDLRMTGREELLRMTDGERMTGQRNDRQGR
jgi:hypothetical protein